MAKAICDVIPQPETVFRGETGSLNRVFAGPGDRVRVSLDLAGCEAGSAGFETGATSTVVSDFNDSTLQGWTASGGGSFGVGDLGLGPSIVGQFACCFGESGARAPAAYLGDWSAMGVTGLSWIWGSFEDASVGGSDPVLRITGPGGSAEYQPDLGFLQQLQAIVITAPIDTSAPPPDWVVTSGTWQGLMSQVGELIVVGTLDPFTDTYVLDDITLTSTTSGSVTTLLYEPPAGPASAIVVPGSGSCAALASELAACQASLGGGTAVCRDDLSPAVATEALHFTMPDAGYAGPLTIAVSPAGAALPCALATTTCGEPGAPTGLLACIDALYASDGTCEAEPVNRHPQFPGFTAVPAPNDFAAICSSPNPSIPCNDSLADLAMTTDAEGNLLVPVDWRGVLVPGTLPIPRLVRASSTVPAFSGAPPEPAQAPGAPVEVPGPGFLQSFSPKGLRVDPLFNPLAGEDASAETELFGSADAEFGVVRLLRRSPEFRQCESGSRAGLPCIADGECPTSQCVAARCRGGSEDGNACSSDAGCPGGACGAPLFDFGDRYSNGGTGPVLVSSAQYDAEAQNPAAIDGLAATEDVFLVVRSEPLEGQDLTGDGDAGDETVVTVQDARTGEEQMIGAGGVAGRAATRVRSGAFSFPTAVVEDDLLAVLEAEPFAGETDLNGDGDESDTLLRVFSVGPAGTVEVTSGIADSDLVVAVQPVVDRAAVEISDGLVFFRRNEEDGALRAVVDLLPGADGGVDYPVLTPDGRYMVFHSDATNLVAGDTNGEFDVFVLDRDVDEDLVFDEPGQTEVVRISVADDGSQASCDAAGCSLTGMVFGGAPDITPDGRFVTYPSSLSGLVPGDTNGNFDVFVHDRDTDADGVYDEPGAIATVRINVDPFGGQTLSAGPFTFPSISGDGRWVFYAGRDTVLGEPDDAVSDVLVHDRDADQDGIFDEPGATSTARLTDLAGLPEPATITAFPTISDDGRHAVLFTDSPLSDGAGGAFVFDRDADRNGLYDEPGTVTFRRITVSSEGVPLAVADVTPFGISDDGSRIAFASASTSLAPGGRDPGTLIFLHERDLDGDGILDERGDVLTRRLARSNATIADAQGLTDVIFRGSLSPDGRRLGAVITNGQDLSIFESFDLDADLPQQIDVTAEGDGRMYVGIAPGADTTAIASLDDAAPTFTFRTEGADRTDLTQDLNGDGDIGDELLVVIDARAPTPTPAVLGPAAAAALAAGHAVFLRPEAADGAGVDLNGDADSDDAVVHLYRNRQGAALNLGLSGRALALSETWLAALVAEADEGLFLNGDGDLGDRVVHVNAVATGTSGTWTNLGLAADAVQVAGSWVAFTVPEAAEGTSLNGDGDLDDRVLYVYDADTASFVAFQDEQGTPIVGLAVDDFQLADGTIAFRVNEAGQGQNLNGVVPPIPGGVADGDLLDSVLHVADLATGTVFNGMQAAIPCPVEACDPRIPYRLVGSKATFLTLEAQQGGNDLDQNGDGGTGLVLQHFNPDALLAGGSMLDASDVVGGALGGICTGTAEACGSSPDCDGGECYFPPGGCVRDTGVACDPSAPACAAGQFCAPTLGMPGVGFCRVVEGPCLTDADCTAPAVCEEDGADVEQLFAAVNAEPDGRQRFVSQGRCSDGDGSCRNDADCNEGATCGGAVTVIATAGDPDADGLADPIDNCDDVANGDQLDGDGDGIGDACDRQTCGNGVQEYQEGCDHGAGNGVDGVCDASCTYVGPGTACSDGIDNDGDGLVDAAADGGCDDGLDTSERTAATACDDGRDNDGDYGVDVGGDPGCKNASRTFEDPACNNGLDDDGDGKVDYDGAGGFYEPDPQCGNPYKNRETKKTGCGLGFELVLLLPLLGGWRRRRRSMRP